MSYKSIDKANDKNYIIDMKKNRLSEKHKQVIKNYSFGMSGSASYKSVFPEISTHNAKSKFKSIIEKPVSVAYLKELVYYRERYVSEANTITMNDVSGKMIDAIEKAERLVTVTEKSGDDKLHLQAIKTYMDLIEKYSKVMGKGTFSNGKLDEELPQIDEPKQLPKDDTDRLIDGIIANE